MGHKKMDCTNCLNIPNGRISSPDTLERFRTFLKNSHQSYSFINYTGERIQPAREKGDGISTLIFTEYFPDMLDVVFICQKCGARWKAQGEFYHGIGGEITSIT